MKTTSRLGIKIMSPLINAIGVIAPSSFLLDTSLTRCNNIIIMFGMNKLNKVVEKYK